MKIEMNNFYSFIRLFAYDNNFISHFLDEDSKIACNSEIRWSSKSTE